MIDVKTAGSEAAAEKTSQPETAAEGTPENGELTLDAVEKQRSQLAILMVIVIVCLAITVVIGSFYFGSYNTQRNRIEGSPAWVRWGLAATTIFLCVYVIYRELALRSMSKALTAKRIEAETIMRRFKEVSALADAGRAMNSGLELKAVLGVILSAAVGLLEGTEGSVMLLDDSKDELVVSSFRGSPTRYDPPPRVRVGAGIAGHVAKTREALLVIGRADTTRYAELEEKAIEIHSSMCVPLVSDGELFGVLNVNDTAGGRNFTESDLKTLQIFAEDAAGAISRARADFG